MCLFLAYIRKLVASNIAAVLSMAISVLSQATCLSHCFFKIISQNSLRIHDTVLRILKP